MSDSRKNNNFIMRMTDAEKLEIETAAVAVGKRPTTWARDELLRLAREINGPAVKKKAATPAKKPAKRKTAGG